MTTLTICRGVSGSGKTSWARQQNAVQVSRDDIRVALFGSEVFDNEDLVTVVEDAAIAGALKAGQDVVVHDTNITWRYVRRIADIGHRAGAEVELKVFDIPLHEAIARNNVRSNEGGRNVPRDVIVKQYNRLQSNKNYVLDAPVPPNKYSGTWGKPNALLVDIDGTLAHNTGGRGFFDWHRVGEDSLDDTVAMVVRHLSTKMIDDSHYMRVIVMSGRDEVCRPQTEAWLEKHNINYDKLLMRPLNDNRKDSIVKMELFDNHVRDNYNVMLVLDDRNQVVDMWRGIGLQVFQVADGDF